VKASVSLLSAKERHYVVECKKAFGNTKKVRQWWLCSKAKIKCVTWNSHRIFQSLWTWLWVRAYMAGPERWWTIPGYSEVMGNCDGGWYQYWRANRLSELGIGAKDSSNYLVAGFLRSFPQDRRSHGAKKKERAKFCDVEQRMRGLDGKFYISQPILKLRRCKD